MKARKYNNQNVVKMSETKIRQSEIVNNNISDVLRKENFYPTEWT